MFLINQNCVACSHSILVSIILGANFGTVWIKAQFPTKRKIQTFVKIVSRASFLINQNSINGHVFVEVIFLTIKELISRKKSRIDQEFLNEL